MNISQIIDCMLVTKVKLIGAFIMYGCTKYKVSGSVFGIADRVLSGSKGRGQVANWNIQTALELQPSSSIMGACIRLSDAIMSYDINQAFQR
jgi:hypothetical protein